MKYIKRSRWNIQKSSFDEEWSGGVGGGGVKGVNKWK